MLHLTSFIQGKLALADCCPIDGSHLDTVKGEDHISYSGGYFLYFLRCKNNHRWLRVITQYEEAPPTLIKGWIRCPEDNNLRDELKGA